MDFAVTYQVHPEDYIDLQLCYNKNSKIVEKGIKNSRINLASFYAFLVLILYHAFDGNARIIILGLLIAAGLVHIALVRRMLEFRTRRLANKMMKSAGENDKVDKKKLRIKGEELEYIENKRTTKFNVKDIVRILESEVNVFIFWDENDAVILPKAIDGEEGTSGKIVEYLKNSTNKDAKSQN